VEHRLYGFRDGGQPFSAAQWAEMAKAEIARAHSLGQVPVLVGGTGLYIRTLLDGIAPVPAVDPGVRAEVRSAEVNENRRRLAALDPEGASKLAPGDTARIARALEVILSTGRPLSHWQERREGGIAENVELRPLILLPPRDWLYQRCDTRFEQMIAAGAVAEVAALIDRKLAPSLPAMRAIGVREIAAFLAGQIGREEMIARGQQATRNYAKRQYTWFAHQPPAHWPRFAEPLGEGTLARALALLKPRA